MTIVKSGDNTFIETFEGESEDKWRAAVERVLASGVDKANWWYPFSVGPTIKFEGRKFRSFRCPAGSVTAWLMVAAEKKQLDRMLLVTGVRASDNQPVVGIWCDGKERTMDASPILSQLDALAPLTARRRLEHAMTRLQQIMFGGNR